MQMCLRRSIKGKLLIFAVLFLVTDVIILQFLFCRWLRPPK